MFSLMGDSFTSIGLQALSFIWSAAINQVHCDRGTLLPVQCRQITSNDILPVEGTCNGDPFPRIVILGEVVSGSTAAAVRAVVAAFNDASFCCRQARRDGCQDR